MASFGWIGESLGGSPCVGLSNEAQVSLLPCVGLLLCPYPVVVTLGSAESEKAGAFNLAVVPRATAVVPVAVYHAAGADQPFGTDDSQQGVAIHVQGSVDVCDSNVHDVSPKVS